MQDILDYFDAVVADPSITDIHVEVIEVSVSTEPNFNYKDAGAFAAAYKRFKYATNLELAIFVAPDDLQFGISRMLASIMDELLEVQIVRGTDELRKYLDYE